MKKIFIILSAVLSVFLFVSCGTTQEIPEDLSSAQLMQQGQNAYSSGSYDLAERYYLETIARFGDDTETYIEARYELGHLYIKTQKYRKAYINFNEVLQIYELAPSGTYPAAYKKLAQNGIASIPAEELEKIKSGTKE